MSKSLYFNINYVCNSRCIFCAARDIGTSATRKEMTPTQFEEILDRMEAGSGDRIILNGGEPTLHRDLHCFLHSITRIGAIPILFTNGIRLSDFDFVRSLVAYQPLSIKIPFFGASASVHDTMTGISGNFEKTFSGFANVMSHIKAGDSVLLEVKMLLCKATYRENLAIAELLMGRFPNQFQFSLNQLIFSEKVMDNAEMLLATFTEMKDDSKRVIEMICENGYDISLGQVPFCIFYDDYPELFPDPSDLDSERWFFDRNRTDMGNISPLGGQASLDECGQCVYQGICNAFYPEYVQTFGKDELRPI